ncbi:methyltransferase domain-containing protein [Enterobacteriaceae bacterium 89]|nr:methyltransferase domain-containing protein [Enterobacteriaceae bacterium 89]
MNTKMTHDFINANLMGPSALLLLDEVADRLQLRPGMRVLDLACGTGLTSIYLAERYGVEVVAMDLWISASDNQKRFAQMGLSQQIMPLHLDVADLPVTLPFATDLFDAMISIDAWHYFGASATFFDSHLAPFIKADGRVAIVVPGLKKPFDRSVPAQLAPWWQPRMNFFTVDWWQQLWQQSEFLRVESCEESLRCREAWQIWLECDHPYAIRDRDMMAAEAGEWFNFTTMVGRVEK